MILYDWLTTQIMPLFCDLNEIIFKYGDMYTITGKTIFDAFFYLAICFAVIMITVVLPYRFFSWLIHGGKGRKKK